MGNDIGCAHRARGEEEGPTYDVEPLTRLREERKLDARDGRRARAAQPQTQHRRRLRENSSHDDFIISAEDDKGGYVRMQGAVAVGGDGREDWANHSSCRSCSRSVARIAGSGGGVLPFLPCLFLRGLTGVKSEYEKDGEAMMTSTVAGQNLTILQHVTSRQPNQLVPAGSITVHRRLPSAYYQCSTSRLSPPTSRNQLISHYGFEAWRESLPVMVSTFLFKSSHRWNRQMILSPRISYSCTPNAKRAAAHQPPNTQIQTHHSPPRTRHPNK